ncbi:flagellar export protein FliJ [Idiomarina sp. PL1-037]|uniref:flagellar export protein FliJ n=1 Tax=Idiomarina TaxID=135575 RepID=UPI00294B2502|nr:MULTISPECIES: flagellar export protein FliJ [unclassified Idiomarina]MDV6328327.1 flagellar export protein FliJ [Idiomarina sp. Sol25]WQC53702.1 flagellar export protein FliJ [Idiomarina sp. PL1-037]
MAELAQLEMLRELEQRREDKAAQDFSQVQQQVQEQQMRLDGMSKYRLDYLNQLQHRGQSGIASMQVGQYHAFVGKLDEGVEQLHHDIIKLQQVLQQRKDRWLAQRRKRESIDFLIKEKRKREQIAEARKEQNNLDDFSSQRFIRARK